MLVLTRKRDCDVLIDLSEICDGMPPIRVTVLEIRVTEGCAHQVRLGFEADKRIKIVRGELKAA